MRYFRLCDHCQGEILGLRYGIPGQYGFVRWVCGSCDCVWTLSFQLLARGTGCPVLRKVETERRERRERRKENSPKISRRNLIAGATRATIGNYRRPDGPLRIKDEGVDTDIRMILGRDYVLV